MKNLTIDTDRKERRQAIEFDLYEALKASRNDSTYISLIKIAEIIKSAISEHEDVNILIKHLIEQNDK